jgi:hypothetical protein
MTPPLRCGKDMSTLFACGGTYYIWNPLSIFINLFK